MMFRTSTSSACASTSPSKYHEQANSPLVQTISSAVLLSGDASQPAIWSTPSGCATTVNARPDRKLTAVPRTTSMPRFSEECRQRPCSASRLSSKSSPRSRPLPRSFGFLFRPWPFARERAGTAAGAGARRAAPRPVCAAGFRFLAGFGGGEGSSAGSSLSLSLELEEEEEEEDGGAEELAGEAGEADDILPSGVPSAES
mmetsp:Transcript_29670/g.92718  ORF Transcript_29670/g.92718 Transcript_29670/m.92718 type:complete len:200 (+) Transcript_29670:87-686(+)